MESRKRIHNHPAPRPHARRTEARRRAAGQADRERRADKQTPRKMQAPRQIPTPALTLEPWALDLADTPPDPPPSLPSPPLWVPAAPSFTVWTGESGSAGTGVPSLTLLARRRGSWMLDRGSDSDCRVRWMSSGGHGGQPPFVLSSFVPSCLVPCLLPDSAVSVPDSVPIVVAVAITSYDCRLPMGLSSSP